MTGHQNKTTDQAHSPFKTTLGKIGDRYQSYSATYKPHAMTTHHGRVRHAGKDRDFDSHIEDVGQPFRLAHSCKRNTQFMTTYRSQRR